jgi:hypothetical protein
VTKPNDLELVEQWLRDARPEPRSQFVRQLEASLQTSSRSTPAKRRGRVLVSASALAGALASLALILGVAGLMPLNSGGERAAEAEDPCVPRMVERRTRVPVLVVRPGKEPRIKYRTGPVRRVAEGCQ